MERCADPLTQLQIDEAILDYLLYTAIRALLRNLQSAILGLRSNDLDDIEFQLQLVDSFLVIFRSRYPGHHGNADLQFRLRLLRFTSLSASRFGSSLAFPTISALQDMRKRQSNRAKTSQFYNSFPNDLNITALGDSLLSPKSEFRTHNHEQNHEHQLGPSATSGAANRMSHDSPSLLDTLPDFMAISAAQIMLQATNITNVWMRLAAGYMSHAVVEQILVYRVPGLEVLRQAFAWGFEEHSNAEEGSDELQINALFLGEDGVVVGWDDIRDAHIRALIPPPSTSLQSHIETLLSNDLPSTVFEQNLLDFLWGLLDSQPRPLWVQIECGNIDGWTRKESEDLSASMAIQ